MFQHRQQFSPGDTESTSGTTASSSWPRRHQAQPDESWTSAALLDTLSAQPTPQHPPPLSVTGGRTNPFPTFGRVEEKLVHAKPEVPLGSAKIDVRPAKTLHVTAQCRHGGQHSCGATHCSLGATLETTLERTASPSLPTSPNHSYYSNTDGGGSPSLSPIQNSHPVAPAVRKRSIDLSCLDEILEDVEIMQENRTTTEWRSSFQSVRNKFGEINGSSSSSSANASNYSTLPRWKVNDKRAVAKSKSMQDVLDRFDARSIGNFAANQTSSSKLDVSQMNRQEWNYSTTGTNLSNGSSSTTTSSGYSSASVTSNYSNTNGGLPTTVTVAQASPYSVGANHTHASPAARNSTAASVPDNDINATLPRWRQKLAERTSQMGSKPAVLIETMDAQNSKQPSGQKPYRERHKTAPINFSALDSAIEHMQHGQHGTENVETTRQNGFPSDHHELSNNLTLRPLNIRPPDQQLVISRSPSPDSTTSDSAGGPIGLPHPKPKHHLREQMISLGVEPRSPTPLKATAGNAANWSFTFPTTGAVLAKVQEIEKRPGTPPLLNPAGLGGSTSPVAGLLSTQLKGFQPTLYRTKPVIHLNVAKSKPQEPPVAGTAEALHQPSLNVPSADVVKTKGLPAPDMGVLETLEKALATPGAPSIDSPMTKLAQSYAQLKPYQVHSSAPSTSTGVTPSPVPAVNYQKSSSQLLQKPQQKRPQLQPPVAPPTASSSHTTTSRVVRKPREHIPRFYFPEGRPSAKSDNEARFKRATNVFNRFSSGQIPIEEIQPLMKALDLPLFVKVPLVQCCSNGAQREYVSYADFCTYWKRMTEKCHDDAAKLVYTLTRGQRRYLEREDFHDMIQDLIDTYNGLYFLKDVPDFHSRYVQTVVSRIFYCANRSWSGKLTAEELRRSNFIQTLRQLEETEDINSVTDYFSYEHFYVIYCKFWELDIDHDLLISRDDLSRHAQGGISPLIIDRVFSGAVSRDRQQLNVDKMSYADFVTFIIAEEDKKHPTSIEYWFRCLDLDGDGVLSYWEMEEFYQQIQAKMDSFGIESMRFEDVLCQMLDIVNPRDASAIRLSDVKRSGSADHFYNTFVNAHKYYEQETSESDQRAAIKGETGEEMSDWERFCAEEYEALMHEEQTTADEDDDGGMLMEEVEINCDPDEETAEVVGGFPLHNNNNNNNADLLKRNQNSLLDAL